MDHTGPQGIRPSRGDGLADLDAGGNLPVFIAFSNQLSAWCYKSVSCFLRLPKRQGSGAVFVPDMGAFISVGIQPAHRHRLDQWPVLLRLVWVVSHRWPWAWTPASSVTTTKRSCLSGQSGGRDSPQRLLALDLPHAWMYHMH